jgi:hypothetical protein
MLRFARAPDGTLVFDVKGRIPGRGAWVCSVARCLDKALEPRHGGFAHAFEAPCLVDGPALAAHVRSTLRGDVLARLGLLRRAGSLVLGREEVFRRAESLDVVAVADDLSRSSREEVARALGTRATIRLPAMALVGAAVGGRPVGVLGIADRAMAQSMTRAVDRWSGVEPALVHAASAPAHDDEEEPSGP